MPFLGDQLGKPELIEAYPLFLILLLATWVRTHAETLYYGLFVARNHRAIWLGNLLFLGASILLNLALVPLFGLNGLGYAALASAMVILIWRQLQMRRENAPAVERRASEEAEWRTASEGEDPN
jgi:O-antigen/teichoic acid export membrane protein